MITFHRIGLNIEVDHVIREGYGVTVFFEIPMDDKSASKNIKQLYLPFAARPFISTIKKIKAGDMISISANVVYDINAVNNKVKLLDVAYNDYNHCEKSEKTTETKIRSFFNLCLTDHPEHLYVITAEYNQIIDKNTGKFSSEVVSSKDVVYKNIEYTIFKDSIQKDAFIFAFNKFNKNPQLKIINELALISAINRKMQLEIKPDYSNVIRLSSKRNPSF